MNKLSKSAPHTNPYDMLTAAGCEIDSHESDLYVKATPEAIAIVKASGWTHEYFTNQRDGTRWIDVAFAFSPWWQRRAMR
jgi:hypothetical protein